MRIKRSDLLFVIAAVVLSYGLFMLRFSLRNDQMAYFLPFRMYMRDAILHHEFLLWNPYISGGYPAHCDMQGAVWNPIAVFFSLVFNYNATVLSLELLVYYVIAVAGCYFFARNFSCCGYSCAVVAAIYGLGGYGVSILEFMSWIGGFAFLPWAAHFFYRLLTKRTVEPAIGLSIALWLMLVCGYPSYLIYLGYCMSVIAAIYLVRLLVRRERRQAARIAGLGLLSLLLVVLLSLPAIQSYIEYLSYYTRGKRALDAHLNGESLSLNYPISLLFPMAGTLVWNNDLYLGLVPLLALLTGGWKRRWPPFRDWVLISGFIYTVLFTLGKSTPVRIWSARHLPLMDAFGFSHSVSVFLLLVLFVWLLPELDLMFSGQAEGWLPRLRYAAGLMALVLLFYVAAEYGHAEFSKSVIWAFYYACAAWEFILLAAILTFRGLFHTPRRLFFFILADLAVSVAFTAPLTGFSLSRPGVYNEFARRFYKSDADLSAGRAEKVRPRDPRKELNAYKVVGRPNFSSNTRNDSFYRYIGVESQFDRLAALPFAYSDNGTPLRLQAIRLGYNFIDLDVRADSACRMVLQQTYYTRWRSAEVRYAPSAYEGIFLQVPLIAGANRVRLYYYKTDLWVEAGISIVTLLVLTVILLQRRRNRYKKRGVKFLNLTF